MAAVFLMPEMLKHDSYEKENSISVLRSKSSKPVFNSFNINAGRRYAMVSSKKIAVDKTVTYQKNGTSELFSIKIDGFEVVALNREDSESVEELLHEALKKEKEFACDRKCR